MPPEPVTWKNSASANSHASIVCATNTGSICVYWRRRPCTTQKKNVFASRRSRSRHARGDVHREEHDGLRRGALAHRELPIAQVVVGERRRILMDRTPLDRFLQRAPPVEPRAHAAPAPALARVVVLAHRAALDLEVRELQLLPEPIDDVVDLELEHELVAALVVAALAFARVAVRRIREHVAGLAVALADAAALARVAQAEARVLEETDRHLDGAVGAWQHVAVRDQLGQLLADGGTNLVVVAQPVARAAREKVVPWRSAPGRSMKSEDLVSTSRCSRRYSCDSNVVT